MTTYKTEAEMNELGYTAVPADDQELGNCDGCEFQGNWTECQDVPCVPAHMGEQVIWVRSADAT